MDTFVHICFHKLSNCIWSHLPAIRRNVVVLKMIVRARSINRFFTINLVDDTCLHKNKLKKTTRYTLRLHTMQSKLKYRIIGICFACVIGHDGVGCLC